MVTFVLHAGKLVGVEREYLSAPIVLNSVQITEKSRKQKMTNLPSEGRRPVLIIVGIIIYSGRWGEWSSDLISLSLNIMQNNLTTRIDTAPPLLFLAGHTLDITGGDTELKTNSSQSKNGPRHLTDFIDLHWGSLGFCHGVHSFRGEDSNGGPILGRWGPLAVGGICRTADLVLCRYEGNRM